MIWSGNFILRHFNFADFTFQPRNFQAAKNCCLKVSHQIVLRKFYYVTNVFNLYIFDKETAALLIFFGICTEMNFVSLFFLNERNITTSLLMIHLKCTFVHYANLNSSSLNKPFLNCGPFNMLFLFFFFNFLYTFLLTRLLSKKLWNNYHFLMQISKIHFKM